jgi:hypothetical protein
MKVGGLGFEVRSSRCFVKAKLLPSKGGSPANAGVRGGGDSLGFEVLFGAKRLPSKGSSPANAGVRGGGDSLGFEVRSSRFFFKAKLLPSKGSSPANAGVRGGGERLAFGVWRSAFGVRWLIRYIPFSA